METGSEMPLKSLGQHWLNDDALLEDIADQADLNPGDSVLEIGPGPGGLTAKLITRAKDVVAVEVDKALIEQLKVKFNHVSNLKLVNADIRSFDLNDLPKGYKVVANIPYYLTSYLIRLLSEADNPPSLCVLLVQKEVAHRLAAIPGNMSILSITAQIYWQVDLGLIVPAEFFTPPPKVDSQVVKLTRRKESLVPDELRERLFSLVKAGFSQKRKKLANTLPDNSHSLLAI